jgi:ribonucleoside-diphosphate reductase beta chain|tara:strand:- start:2263 stop:3294 length:1032 start_codon:yes stop_codon:yes gene_type:complete
MVKKKETPPNKKLAGKEGALTIFDEQTSRKPNLYPWTEPFIRAMHDGFWTDREFSFKSDVQQFKVELTEQYRVIVVRTLSCIGQVEVAPKSFWAKLGDNLPHPSLQDLGYVMANTEVIHNNAYERLLDILDLNEVFEENLKLEWVQGRVKYLKKYTHRFYKDSKKQYCYAIILFTMFVENVSLFSQFYVINWFNTYKNVLKDTNQQVAYTRNEETIHFLVGVQIINTIREEMPEIFDDEFEKKIRHEAEEAYKAEAKIIDWMINGIDEPHLSAPLLKEFVKNRINESLAQIGYSKVFEVDETLLEDTIWFDEQVLGNSMTDFFHGRPTEYSKKNQSFDENDLF